MMRGKARFVTSGARAWPFCALAGFVLGTAAHGQSALPDGGTVVAGSAVIGMPTGSSLTVTQDSARAIIDWNGFSVGAGGGVRFDNGTGATLNRVTGATVSSIDGVLSASGSVYLLNPNGVVIGKDGVVDVGGSFVAATLDVANDGFMAGGDLTLAGDSHAAIVNLGRIGALGGDVALLARQVENRGAIMAAHGTAALAAGGEVLIRDAALDGGRFVVRVGGAGTSAANAGTIAAAATELRANGGNVYALAGDAATIAATGVTARDGRIWLTAGDAGTVAVGGTLTARAASGGPGFIETSGGTVAIRAATIDAGAGGTWLLDPTDLTIDQTAATTISGSLNAGTGVTQSTSAAGTGGSGDITVDPGVTIAWGTNASLTLSAYRNVALGNDATITSSGGGAVTLYADNAGTGTGAVTFGGGALVSTSGAVNVYYDTAQNAAVAGGGTLTAYRLVNTAADLQAIQSNGTYALGRDIDLGGEQIGPITRPGVIYNQYGQPIYTSGGFSGILDGLGRSIRNLNLTGNAQGFTPPPRYNTNFGGTPANFNVGLFDYLTSTAIIRNLNLVGGTVSGGLSLGGAGSPSQLGALAGSNQGGTISNVTSDVAVTGFGFSSVGGLVGASSGTISNSLASGTVTANTGSTSASPYYGYYDPMSLVISVFVGGLAGYNSGTIINSAATGTTTGTASGGIGGLVGNSVGTITNSYASGAVIARVLRTQGSCDYYYSYCTPDREFYTQNAGGLAGYNSGTIAQSYAVGAVDGAGSINVGGFAGSNVGTIGGAYASGAVTPSSGVGSGVTGGFVGVNGSDGTIVNAFWDQGTTGQATGVATPGGTITRLTAIGGGTGVDRYAQATYSVFAFGAGGDWLIFEGLTRPILQSEYSTRIATPHQLQLIAANPGAAYTLATDLDLSGTTRLSDIWSNAGFVPIGTVAAPFAGSLDGRNRSLAGLTIDGGTSDPIGLFGAIGAGASVRSLSLTDGSVRGGASSTNVGALAGMNSGTISDVFATVTVSAVGGNAGGLVGANGGAIAGARVVGTATGANIAGGLAGINSGSIAGSSASVAVTAGAANGMAGGLVGYSTGTVSDSYATGGVAGGAAGSAGGLIGTIGNEAGTSPASGGTVTRSYASGPVTGGTAGGIVGVNRGLASDSYWDAGTFAGNAIGASEGGAGTNLSAVGGAGGRNAYAESSYAALDLSAAGPWVIFDGFTRPLLRAEYRTTISDAHQLQLVSLDPAARYSLAADISLAAIGNPSEIWNPATGFVPIGEANDGLAGSFDGMGHVLSGLIIRRADSDNVGLFAGVGGTVKRLTLNDASVVGRNNVGAVAGFNTGTISGVTVRGTVTAANSAGGIVGYNLSFASGTVLAGSTITASNFAGGVVGYNAALANGTVAAIVAATSSYAGGLTGYNDRGGDIYGNVSGTISAGEYAGGITGFNGGAFRGSNVASGTRVSATRGAGGAVGFNNGSAAYASVLADVSASSLAGGFAGVNFGEIASQSASGAVSGGTEVGGFVGANGKGGTLSYVSATGAVTGTAALGGLAGYNDGVILTSNASGSVAAAGSAAASYVGGLVGFNARSISGSSATGSVTGAQWVGGLVGYTDMRASIDNSGASGLVTGVDYAGGLAGYNGGTIEFSNANAAVTASGRGAGGLVGYNVGTVSHAYALGTVAAPTLAGGLVALNFGDVTLSFAAAGVSGGNTAGGLVGYNAGTLARTYSVGSVSGTAAIGGLVGTNNATISDSYATGSATGGDALTTGGLVGLADAQSMIVRAYAAGPVSAGGGGVTGTNRGMLASTFFDMASAGTGSGTATGEASGSAAVGGTSGRSAFGQASYPGFDFATVWTIQQGLSRPYLRDNPQAPPPQ